MTVPKYQEYFDKRFDEIQAKMATKDSIKDLHDTIVQQNSKIDALEAKVEMMESYIAHMENGIDEQEQYNRRLCLRIDGIVPPKQGQSETGDQCLKKVKSMFKELKVAISDEVIYRAHRIGKPKVKNGINIHTMIVRFTTWRHRTAVYRARKVSSKYKIRLDLTKKRLNAIVKVSKDLDTKKLGFAFADVNCRLCAKVGDKFVYFNANDDLDAFVNRFETEDDGDDGNEEQNEEQIEKESSESEDESEAE